MLYRILNITDAAIYSAVIRYAMQKSTCFNVCTFQSYRRRELSEAYYSFFENLSSCELQSNLHVPRPYTKGQKYHIFQLTAESARMIRAVPCVECWTPPDYPEDITFYQDGRPLLYTITRERIAYITVKSAEMDIIKASGAELLEIRDFKF